MFRFRTFVLKTSVYHCAARAGPLQEMQIKPKPFMLKDTSLMERLKASNPIDSILDNSFPKKNQRFFPRDCPYNTEITRAYLACEMLCELMTLWYHRYFK
jgi:hypothetical protein